MELEKVEKIKTLAVELIRAKKRLETRKKNYDKNPKHTKSDSYKKDRDYTKEHIIKPLEKKLKEAIK